MSGLEAQRGRELRRVPRGAGGRRYRRGRGAGAEPAQVVWGCGGARNGAKRVFCFVFYGRRHSALSVGVFGSLSMWQGEGASGSPQLRGSHAISFLLNATGGFEVRKARRGSIY